MKKTFIFLTILLFTVNAFAANGKVEFTTVTEWLNANGYSPNYQYYPGEIIEQWASPCINPMGMAWDPAGNSIWLGAEKRGDVLYEIEIASPHNVINSYPCPNPYGLSIPLVNGVCFGNGYLYYTDYRGSGSTVGDHIVQVDRSTMTAVNWWEVSPDITAILGITYNDPYFYITGLSTALIYEVDLQRDHTYTIVNVYPAPYNNTVSGIHYLSYNDTYWLTSFSSGFITETDGDFNVLQTIVSPPGGWVFGITWPGEGENLWLASCINDQLYIIDGDIDPLNAPGPPTDVVVTPDAGGALEAQIYWTCPTLQVNGDPLTELLEMRVYRDGVLIYTDTSPLIGGPGTYTDIAFTVPGMHAYKVVGYNTAAVGEGIGVTVSVWVGENVPNVVENLLLVNQAGNGYLTWGNPTTGLHGGAFNEPILGYHIVRYPDIVTFEVTGIQTDYQDTTIPITTPDYYQYTVTPYNCIGDGGTETSNAVLVADPGLLIMEDFSGGVPPAGWYIDGLGQTNWLSQGTTNAGGTPPEMFFFWIPQFVGVSRMCTMPVNSAGMNELNLEFKYSVSAFLGGYSLGVATTSDGTTWNTAWDINVTASIPATTETVTITNPDVGSPTFQMCFYFDGDSYNASWWAIDDVILIGSGDPGWIEGIVTLDGGTGNVEDVEVTAGSVTVNPDASGFYSIGIRAQTYDVTASLAGYEDDIFTGVVVEEGLTTTGVDLSLTYISPTFDPPVNLAVECIDDYALFTWDHGILYELFQHDGNPVNAYYQNYGYGYGVVYDLSGYTNVTIEMVDYRHSSWGIFGIYDYKIHIVDWDTYTELAVTGILQTTGDDRWEEGIDLGSIPVDGLVGIFLEPLSNSPTDAYPCIDGDGVTNGTSYYGDLTNYSDFNVSDIGDFLMDLWIMAGGTRELVKAKVLPVELIVEQNTRLPVNQVEFVSTQHTENTRELLGYDVYLDEVLAGNTTLEEWHFFDLINGNYYDAGAKAIYDYGESELVEINFQYTGLGTGDIVVATTELKGNYPNPFNPTTTISFSLTTEHTESTEIYIYNLKGQKVKTLINDKLEAGSHQVMWDGTDDSAKPVSSGIYFYKMNTGEYTSIKKMILMK